MAQIFPRWSNKAPLIVLASIIILGVGLIGMIGYYGSPKYTDVGYQPKQPLDYSHKLHAGELDIDCRYCHSSIEQSAHANIPSTQTCMNCHQQILPNSEKLILVRESWQTGKPLEWIKVHDLPDYAYFDHSAHLRAGVGCITCHGNVAEMDIVELVEPLSMGWCLECHRAPEKHIRPTSEITNMNWTPPVDHAQFVTQFINDKKIAPPTDCSGCHR